MAEDLRESTGVAAEDQATLHAPLSLPPSATMRAAPAVGDRVGKYVIERTIGQGGMGIVVAARHETLQDMVAIKLLRPKAARDAVQVERFVREARATVRIKSDHVVRVLDAGAEEATGAPFIVMELLEGRDLGNVLATSGAMPTTMAVDCIIQICEAVGAAHALGIIHRDLKPSNFFLTQRGDGTPLVKVLDFGISKAAQSEGEPDPRLTETQAVFGSPTYMSPEQIRSSKNVDARSDVWSLGVALFEMLTGKLPFIADNVAGLLASVIADAPFPLSTFVSDVPPELEAIVLACLEKDAARRIGSAGELAMRLAPFASPAYALLATRVDRSGRSVTGPSLGGLSPPGSMPPPPLLSGRGTAPIVPLAPMSYPSSPAPAVVFGNTGTDLSATGPGAFHASVRRGSGRSVALVVGALAFLGVASALVYVGLADRSARGASSAAANSASTGLPAASAPVSTAAAPTTAPSSAAGAPTADAPVGAAVVTSPAAPRRGRPGAAGQGRPVPPRASSVASAAASAPHVAPPAPPPVRPGSANLDSRE